MTRNLKALVFILTATFTSAGYPQESLQSIKERVVEHELSNGMKLLMLRRDVAPVVSFINIVHVGSVNEEAGYTGLAHMFEHMAFKGSHRIGTNNYEEETKVMAKIDALVEELLAEKWKGSLADQKRMPELKEKIKAAQEEAAKYVVSNEFGEIAERHGANGLNAYTASDMTGYIMSVPSNKLEVLFALETERLLNPVTREFYKERDVVKEERRMRTEDNPTGKLIEELLAVAYKAHPYGWPVVGHMDDLDNLTRKKADEFYKKYYVPNNMVIGLVGDIDIEGTKKLAEEYFGKIPRGAKPPRVVTKEPPQEGEKTVTIESAAQPIFVLTFHKENSMHEDEAVFSCLNGVLSDGRTSRLYKKLVKESKIAIAAGAFPGFPGEQYPNLYIVYAVPAAGHTNEEVQAAIEEEIERLKTELVTEEELNKVKSRADATFIRGLQSNMGIAHSLAQREAISGDWRLMFDELDRIKAVTEEDIKRVANKYLQKKNRIVAKIVTKEQGQ